MFAIHANSQQIDCKNVGEDTLRKYRTRKKKKKKRKGHRKNKIE